MNKEILTMIDLQKHMDDILFYQAQIKDQQEKLAELTDECASCGHRIALAEEKLMSVKASIKANELDLREADERKIKLETRKYTLSHERDIEAVNREIDAVTAQIGQYEESLISLMDENDLHEKNIAQLKKEYSEKQTVCAGVQTDTEQKIKEWSASENSHREQYDVRIKDLDKRVQPKFSKIISGTPFRAIAAVKNSTCGACNFNIPSSLVHESMEEDALVTCTNCGRFIYSVPAETQSES